MTTTTSVAYTRGVNQVQWKLVDTAFVVCVSERQSNSVDRALLGNRPATTVGAEFKCRNGSNYNATVACGQSKPRQAAMSRRSSGFNAIYTQLCFVVV